LFGQAAAVLTADLWLLGPLTLGILAVVALLWKELKLISFDPVFARVTGLPVFWLEALLTVMVALAVVVGLQMVGVVLMAAMLVAPAVAARQWTRRLEHMALLSALLGATAGVAGAVVSSLAPGLATGPLVVLIASGFVAVSLLAAPGRGLLWQALVRRAERRRLESDTVLDTVRSLAQQHGDLAYPVERSMLDAYHGARTRRAVTDLEQRGLIASASHMPTEGEHWVLTPKGREASDA
jgi:manganese/zinc/iron transport system permease protein